MKEDLILFNKVKSTIKNKNNFLEKGFTSLGGVWCVDTWVKDDIVFQVMEEGYTERIFIKEKLDVIKNFDNSIKYIVGNKNCLEDLII